jgi:hypothetical protein
VLDWHEVDALVTARLPAAFGQAIIGKGVDVLVAA